MSKLRARSPQPDIRLLITGPPATRSPPVCSLSWTSGPTRLWIDPERAFLPFRRRGHLKAYATRHAVRAFLVVGLVKVYQQKRAGEVLTNNLAGSLLFKSRRLLSS